MYVGVILVGGLVIVLGIVLGVVAVTNAPNRARLVGGAVTLAALGAVVAAWSVKQLRLPIPLDAPVRRSRLWLWITLFVIGLLLFGGCCSFSCIS